MFCCKFHLCPTARCLWRQLLAASQPCLLRVPAANSVKQSALLPPLGCAPQTFFLSPLLSRKSPSPGRHRGPWDELVLSDSPDLAGGFQKLFLLILTSTIPRGRNALLLCSDPFCCLAWRAHNMVQSQGSCGRSWEWSGQSGMRVVLAVGHCCSLRRPDF